MGKASRRKGAEGEQAVARLFREAGWDVRGVQRGAADAGDLLATLNRADPLAAIAANAESWHGIGEHGPRRALDVIATWARDPSVIPAGVLEASPPNLLQLVLDSKRQERIRLLEWSRQVEGIARDGEAPCVVWRPSREPWRVSLRLDDLLGMLAS